MTHSTFRWMPVLVLSVAAGVAFAQDVPKSPDEGGPRRFEVTGITSALNLRESPSTTAPVVARLALGAILSNLGCQSADGKVWCDVQDFRGGPRGYASAEYLKPASSPSGEVLMGADNSALRAGQGKFDATGNLPCAMSSEAAMATCHFGVARAGGGDATVVITKPDGTQRVIYFALGNPLGASTSQADPASFDFAASRDGDMNKIRVGQERYEIADAVALGG